MQPEYSIRPSDRRDDTGLDTAFRVRMTQKVLDENRLKAGELCCLRTPEKHAAIGAAFLTTGGGVKNLVQITDLFRNLYDLKLDDKVSLEKTEDNRTVAQTIIVEAADTDQRGPLTYDFPDHDTVLFRAHAALEKAGDVCIHGTLNVESSLRARRRCFVVKSVEPKEAAIKHYCCTVRTRLSIHESGFSGSSTSDGTTLDHAEALRSIEIDFTEVAGLDSQLKTLQNVVKRMIGPAPRSLALRSRSRLDHGSSILLTGPEGTGKSLIISRIEATFTHLHRIEADTIGTTAKEARGKLTKIFDEALKTQPSIVTLDRYETIIGDAETARQDLIDALATNLRRLHGSRVLVVAAAQSLKAVHKSLRNYDTFATTIEIPVPNARARTAIIETLLQTTRRDNLYDRIGDKTHGYVGQDLRELCIVALKNASARIERAAKQGAEDDSNVDAANAVENGLKRVAPFLEDAAETTDGFIEDALIESDFLAALQIVRPSAMKEVFLETPKVRWSDIGGISTVKEAMYKITTRPYLYPQLVSNLDLLQPKGILLYGPPGCSKTLTAQAVATEAGMPFLAVKGAELVNMYVGESERAIRELFRKARSASPSVIFFDEIDSIAGSSRGGGTNGLNVVTTLLNEMDGIEAMGSVLVIAATNAPEILDPALMRPGRMDTILYVGPPDGPAREEIFKIRCRNRRIAEDVDFKVLAEQSNGHSGAEVARICDLAAEETASEWERGSKEQAADQLQVCMRHFEAALKQVPKQITQEMRWRYENWKPGNVQKLL